MSNIDMTAVAEFREHYLETIKKRPGLYRTNDEMITVVLPKDLLEYSNAAAGHSGFGTGARPVGIRRHVRNADEALADIFESVDSLANFVLSSERDGVEYVNQIRKRHAAPPVEPKAVEVFWQRYNKDTMQSIVKKFGRKPVEEAFKTLNIAEFEQRFQLAA